MTRPKPLSDVSFGEMFADEAGRGEWHTCKGCNNRYHDRDTIVASDLCPQCRIYEKEWKRERGNSPLPGWVTGETP